jgi:hypothetical protein
MKTKVRGESSQPPIRTGRDAATVRNRKARRAWQVVDAVVKRCTLASTLCLIPSLTALAENAQPSATVNIVTEPCDFQARTFVGAQLQYSVSSGSGFRISKKTRWNSAEKSQLQWSVQVPPGVYSYDVTGNVHPTDLPCMSSGFFAALPGSVRRIGAAMHGGIQDPLAPLFIFGTEPPGVHASIVRFDGRPGCDSRLSSIATHSIAAEYDDVGYYGADYDWASDPSLDTPEGRENIAFGIRVQRANQPERTLRIVASYPSESIAVPPTSARFDLTPAALDAAYRHSGNGGEKLTPFRR